MKRPSSLVGAKFAAAMDVTDDDAATTAVARLRESLRATAAASPDSLADLVSDASVLAKLLRNPVEQPDEPKFRKVKTTNTKVARALAHAGGREALLACGFAGDDTTEFLSLSDPHPWMATLRRAVKAVEEVMWMLQELHWVRSIWVEVASLQTQPWSLDGGPKLLAHDHERRKTCSDGRH